MALAGHVPDSVRVAESDAGHRTIEHLTGVALGCSGVEQELMDERAEAFAARDPTRYERAGSRAVETFDESRATALFTLFVKNGTWQVPKEAQGPADGEAGRRLFASEIGLVRAMHAAGVLFMAGTDSANPSVLPG